MTERSRPGELLALRWSGFDMDARTLTVTQTAYRASCATSARPRKSLRALASKLGLAKLNFQVLRRTMATLAQTKGGAKDVQGIVGHSKADTTVNVYMQ
jgi:integrase